MATAINSLVLYKAAHGFIPAIVQRAYDVNGDPVDNAATTDTSITHADLLVLGVDPTKLSLVAKETTVAGTDGAIAAGSDAQTTVASMATGKWFTLT
jgi:hypothetical protein